MTNYLNDKFILFTMSEVVDYKKEVKKLKKKVEKFKQVCKVDKRKGLEMAKGLKKDIVLIRSLKEVKEDKKVMKNIEMTEAALDVFIDTMTKIFGFKDKCDTKSKKSRQKEAKKSEKKIT